MSDPADALPREVAQALAADLATLALLHDAEPAAALLEELASSPMRDWLALELRSEPAVEGCALLDRALAGLERPVGQATLDALAADFAAIYLVHACRAAPSESPWLDKDQIERQEPMFEVRGWYRHYGLAVENWAERPDDHLVNQLRFLAHLLGEVSGPVALRDAARFLDAHTLRWVPQFARRVAARCATPYFAGLALLTLGYLDELRELLAEVTLEPRPEPGPSEPVEQPQPEPVRAYLPGAGPSW